MPPVEITWYSWQNPAFWVAVATVLLAFFAWRPLSKVIVGALDSRTARIEKEIKDAQELLAEAHALLTKYSRDQEAARIEAEDIIRQAQQEAELIRARAAEELTHTLTAYEKHALDRITQAENAAVAEIRDIAVDVSLMAARQSLAQQLPDDQQHKLLHSAVADIQQRLN